MTLPPPAAPVPTPSRPWSARPGLPPSVIVLIAANLVPLVGVMTLHWTVFSVILLYWCENVVIGGYNVLRMLVASPRNIAADVGKVFLIPFFIVHYGMFTFVHGIFVLALFGSTPLSRGFPGPATFAAAIRGAGIGFAVVVLVLSHGFSFFHNYLFSGEYRNASLQQLMGQPYARVMILHFSILVGGFAAKAMGSPEVVLILLVVLKTAIDLGAHLRERKKLGTPALGEV